MEQAKRLDDLFELRDVAGKRVYIVDEHHKVFAPWSLLRRDLGEAFVLITLDHHTDTHEAFGTESAVQSPYDSAEKASIQAALVSKLGWQDDAQVLFAIANLRHDEHIDAAIQAGALSAAFCIQHMDIDGSPRANEQIADRKVRFGTFPPNHAIPVPQRPFTYDAPPNRVFTVPDDCWMLCEEADDPEKPHRYNHVLEAWYLRDQLGRASEMSRSIGLDTPQTAPYVLDVDLDVFHTLRAIQPDDPSAFYELIRGAAAITIATESECVDEWWRDEANKLTAEDLLSRLLEHVTRALA